MHHAYRQQGGGSECNWACGIRDNDDDDKLLV